MANETYDVQHLLQQLATARNEISNLRQQLKSLNFVHQKDCGKIKEMLENWRCSECRSNISTEVTRQIDGEIENGIRMTEIGIVKTNFPEKRGIPRQPNICTDSVGKLILSNDVFTNPEHSLEGLEDYSHMWILYYFHKNESTHVRAKVAPPRLNGLRTGVFATRSPHRPCPIGLSLVKIEKVENHTIFFSGVDMVDGTPVLDMKPYIPQYDSPGYTVPELNDSLQERLLDGRENETPIQSQPIRNIDNTLNDSVNSNRSDSRIGEREAPDGEEEEGTHLGASGSIAGSSHNGHINTPEGHIRIPSWINEPPVQTLLVTFSERALAQLQELQGPNAVDRQNTITNILREDPRSVYLRARWGNQYYTFRIAELHVSCKFDDTSHSVTVFQIRSADSITDE